VKQPQWSSISGYNTDQIIDLIDRLSSQYSSESFDLLIFYSQAFGHHVTVLDAVNRLSSHNELLLIILCDRRFNRHLPHLYPCIRGIYVSLDFQEEIMANIAFASHVASVAAQHRRVRNSYTEYTYLSSINDFAAGYDSCSVGDSNNGAISYRIATAPELLIKENVGPMPMLPDDKIRHCKHLLAFLFGEVYEHTSRIAYLHTRKKTSLAISCISRSARDYTTYLPMIRTLAAKEFLVIVGGDVPFDVFSSESHPHIKSLHDALGDDDQRLLNLYLLAYADLYIGHTSGPNVLVASRKVPQLNVNAFPHCLGTVSSLDIHLYKSIRINNSIMPYDALLHNSRFHDIHFGIIDTRFMEIQDNTADQLLQAVEASITTVATGAVNPTLFGLNTAIRQWIPTRSALKLHSSMIYNLLIDG